MYNVRRCRGVGGDVDDYQISVTNTDFDDDDDDDDGRENALAFRPAEIGHNALIILVFQCIFTKRDISYACQRHFQINSITILTPQKAYGNANVALIYVHL